MAELLLGGWALLVSTASPESRTGPRHAVPAQLLIASSCSAQPWALALP